MALSAIHPESNNIETITATDMRAAENFVLRYNGQRNLYYALNPLRGNQSKKAKKTDVSHIAFVHADLDPNDGETSEAAKARFMAALDLWRPHLLGVIDSGNGIQAIGRLPQGDKIALGEPMCVKDDEGKDKLVLAPEDRELASHFEARLEAWMLDLGSKAGTQNIDRILRLPGTWNLPSKKKLEVGRQRCLSRLLQINAGAEFPLDKLPPPKAKAEEEQQPGDESSSEEGAADDLDHLIRTGGAHVFGGDRSKAVWKVINMMLRLGYLQRTIIATLLDRRNGISAHVSDQSDPRAYAERQVGKAKLQIDFAADKNKRPYVTQNNMRVALLKMVVALSYDKFADHVLVSGLKDFGPVLDDAAMTRLRLTIEQRFHFLPSKEIFYDVVADVGRRNAFHPVRDYLGGLRWDGTKRIDTWLTSYGGAEDSGYTRAVGALTLVAAVRRVRQPGCKFDEMPVLESPQGLNKSSALRVMAVHDDWFLDDLPLNASGKNAIEQQRGKWIIECAELSGMRRTEIERVKAFVSHQTDRGRLAYDRLTSEVPRQCIYVGTTNDTEYLKDTTGNRRFWPVKIERFDIIALRRDRDQLWAEAAAREAEGASIRLAPELWPKAAEEQEERTAADPFFEDLEMHLGDRAGKIACSDVRVILDVRSATQDHNVRIGKAMRALGWKRTIASFEGTKMRAYVKGENDGKAELETITASRNREGLYVSGGDATILTAMGDEQWRSTTPAGRSKTSRSTHSAGSKSTTRACTGGSVRTRDATSGFAKSAREILRAASPADLSAASCYRRYNEGKKRVDTGAAATAASAKHGE